MYATKDNEKYVDGSSGPQRVLPILALNEVFVGESLSARYKLYLNHYINMLLETFKTI